MHTEHFSPGNRLFLSNMSTERSNMASTGDDSDQAIWKPSPPSPDSWKTWTYAEWNERLLEYCLARHDGADGTPVTRIAATPEELTLVVGDDSAAPEAVAERFVEVIRQELPPGRSFSGYCRDYVSYARQSKNPWTPESRDSPHFFAMLWFTCLVAYGYPDASEGFHNRITYLIFSKHDQLTQLPKIWRDFREWTHQQVHVGAPIYELVLPPEDTFRAVIGYSYFLAFPHQHDRHILAEVLAEARLVGIEPPVSLTLEALEKSRGRFSDGFKQDIDNLIEVFLEKGKDLRDSAFWRAVRQEAQRPSSERATSEHPSPGKVTIFAWWDSDELLRPYLACTRDWIPPSGLVKTPLDFTVGRFSHQVESNDSDNTAVVLERVLHDAGVVTGDAKRAVEQGILPLDSVTSDEFRLATGGSITGCTLALVREDLVESFIDTYGGSREESAFAGWFEIAGCNIRELDELPESMLDATMLLHTTDSQRPRFVGGLRTLSGNFYLLNTYLPKVRAPEAQGVELLVDSRRLACTQDPYENGSRGDWRLPRSLPLDQLNELLVEAQWKIRIGQYEITRATRCRGEVIKWNFSIRYRPVPTGSYWRETCARKMQPFEGPALEVPTGVTTQDPACVADLFSFDTTARWLGPGIGEISLTPRAAFQWLAVGPKNCPDFLVFVGDTTAPTLPDGGSSPDKSDRRHWRRAFTGGRVAAYVAQDRNYVPVSENRPIDAVYKRYRSAARLQNLKKGRQCRPTKLADGLPTKIWGVDRISDEAAVLGETLSILACNKSGVPLREIHDHVGRLTGTDSLHTLRQQIVRGWAESGAIDLLQRQDGRRTVVVARKPRFVVFRRGPTYLGTLLGLLPQSLEGELERVAKRLGVNLSWQRPANRLQPFAARISDTSGEDIRELSKALGYEDFELLDWSDSSKLPDHLQVKGDLRQDAPPDVYEREAQWCAIHLAFRRIPKDPGEIVVERRGHGKRAPIYVVLDRGNPIGWSYSRTWALLNASERGKQPPFKLTNDGILRTRGRSPLHLPLPLARLCAVVGMGLPGPELEKQGSHIDVKAYVYPFGPRLGQLVKAVIPSSWVRR